MGIETEDFVSSLSNTIGTPEAYADMKSCELHGGWLFILQQSVDCVDLCVELP